MTALPRNPLFWIRNREQQRCLSLNRSSFGMRNSLEPLIENYETSCETQTSRTSGSDGNKPHSQWNLGCRSIEDTKGCYCKFIPCMVYWNKGYYDFLRTNEVRGPQMSNDARTANESRDVARLEGYSLQIYSTFLLGRDLPVSQLSTEKEGQAGEFEGSFDPPRMIAARWPGKNQVKFELSTANPSRVLEALGYDCDGQSNETSKYFWSLSNKRYCRKLLPQRTFRIVRGLLWHNRFEDFCEDLSIISIQMMIASGIFCIDESLWKFVCKQKGSDSENAKVVRAIPRKPAKIGLLSYELSGFLTRSNKPYTFGIIPMTHRQHCTPTEAADYLMKLYNCSHKPGGSPQPFVIMDSAFSSEACLKLAQENGWLFSVSVNSQLYSSLSTAIRAGLQRFEYRMFQTSDGLVMTAYNSQFEPSSKKNRGSKTETQLEVLNLTSALRFRQTLISDLTPMTRSSTTEVSFFGKTYSRDQLARLPVDSCKNLLKQLGFTGIRSLRKKECVDLLLEIRNEEHLSDIARTMLSKKDTSKDTELPHLSIYRNHFASLDRVD